MSVVEGQGSPRQFGPTVRMDRFDHCPDELRWQEPVTGQLYRVLPGPDRPDYSLVLLERPLLTYPSGSLDAARLPSAARVTDRRGRPMVRSDALVVCARFVGEQLHAGMTGLAVNVALVLDPRVLGAARLDLSACHPVAVANLTDLTDLTTP